MVLVVGKRVARSRDYPSFLISFSKDSLHVAHIPNFLGCFLECLNWGSSSLMCSWFEAHLHLIGRFQCRYLPAAHGLDFCNNCICLVCNNFYIHVCPMADKPRRQSLIRLSYSSNGPHSNRSDCSCCWIQQADSFFYKQVLALLRNSEPSFVTF